MRQLVQTLLISVLLPLVLPAQQNPQRDFRNYSTAAGLPSPEVYCVLEDSQGYMWFGTDNGAARFDGSAFKTYGTREGKISLEEEISFLNNYLALERERFDYSLEVDEALRQQSVYFPPLLIRSYIENAIIHGLSKKTEKGKVKVLFSKEYERKKIQPI